MIGYSLYVGSAGGTRRFDTISLVTATSEAVTYSANRGLLESRPGVRRVEAVQRDRLEFHTSFSRRLGGVPHDVAEFLLRGLLPLFGDQATGVAHDLLDDAQELPDLVPQSENRVHEVGADVG